MAGPGIGSLEMEEILCIVSRKTTMDNSRWFSDTTSADVYEVRNNGELVVTNDMCDKGIMEMLKGGTEEVKFRMICIDGVEGDTEKLKITSSLLAAVFRNYQVSPRVAGMISTQHMPGRIIQYDRETGKPVHFQHWYSAVVRDLSTDDPNNPLTPSKCVLGWSRFISWTGHDILTNTTTMLLFNCPTFTKQAFTSAFAPHPQPLLAHPHLANTFLLESLVQHARDFFFRISTPLYSHEFQVGNSSTTKEYTERSRHFLTLTRQVTQVITDFTILSWTIEHMESQHKWLLANLPPEQASEQEFPQKTWDFFYGELALLKTYSNHCRERAKIGVNECFAMVNQRDAETNLQMAAESTQISRAAHQDGRSLRAIQILTMVFLPASVCSGIFGMGFFNTSVVGDEGGKGGVVRFSVSKEWWWFLALTVPLTVVLGVVVGGCGAWRWGWRRRKSVVDVEKRV